MVATLSRTSIVEIRSNVNYCSNQCRSYDCFSGKKDIPGCPMVKGPFALETNHNCIVCGNCIKNCPNQSVRLNLRPPGWELWNVKKADLTVILIVPLLWGTQVFRGLDNTDVPQSLAASMGSPFMAYTILLVLCAAFSYHVAIAGVAFMNFGVNSSRGEQGARFVLAMLPLTYTIEVATRLVPLFNHAGDFFVILGNQIGYAIPHVAFRLDVESIHILQIFLTVAGFFLSLFVLTKLVEEESESTATIRFFRRLPLVVMAAISIFLY